MPVRMEPKRVSTVVALGFNDPARVDWFQRFVHLAYPWCRKSRLQCALLLECDEGAAARMLAVAREKGMPEGESPTVVLVTAP